MINYKNADNIPNDPMKNSEPLSSISPRKLHIGDNYHSMLLKGKIKKISRNLAERAAQSSDITIKDLDPMIDDGALYRNLEEISKQIELPDKEYTDNDAFLALADNYVSFDPQKILPRLLMNIGSAMALMSYNDRLPQYDIEKHGHIRSDVGEDSIPLKSIDRSPLSYSGMFTDEMDPKSFKKDILSEVPYYNSIREIEIGDWQPAMDLDGRFTTSRNISDNINYVTIRFRKEIPKKLIDRMKYDIAISNNDITSKKKNPDLIGLRPSKTGKNAIDEQVIIPSSNWYEGGLLFKNRWLNTIIFEDDSIKVGYVPTQIKQTMSPRQYYPSILTMKFVSGFYDRLRKSRY